MAPGDYRTLADRMLQCGFDAADPVRRVAYFELAYSYIRRAEMVEATLRRQRRQAA